MEYKITVILNLLLKCFSEKLSSETLKAELQTQTHTNRFSHSLEVNRADFINSKAADLHATSTSTYSFCWIFLKTNYCFHQPTTYNTTASHKWEYLKYDHQNTSVYTYVSFNNKRNMFRKTEQVLNISGHRNQQYIFITLYNNSY